MPLKPVKYIEIDDQEGLLYSAGIRSLIIPATFVESMSAVLSEIIERPGSQLLIYRIGEELGRQYAQTLKNIFQKERLNLAQETVLIEIYNAIFMSAGWGRVIIKNYVLKTKSIVLEVANTPCGLASKLDQCAFQRGILAGAYKEIIGEEIYFELAENKGNDKAIIFRTLEKIPGQILTKGETVFYTRKHLEEKIKNRTETLEIKTRELEETRKALINILEDIEESQEKVERAYQIEKKARLELEKLDKVKNQFLLTTQHHLRTPLTIIKGYVEQLIKNKLGLLTPSMASAVQRIGGTIDRLAKLINEFLDVSQLEIGKGIFNLQLIKIKPIIDDILDDLKPDITKRNIDVSFADDFLSWPLLLIDSIKFREALYILVDNAIKYNFPNGKIFFSAEIKSHPTDSGKKLFQIHIKDTGIGIIKEDLPKLFKQYFLRGAEAEKIHTTGKGIGLVLAKNIIEAHHGRVWAKSEGKNKGAEFIVELEIPKIEAK